ncbi:MAG: beta/gamma crystallin family protein, partial [bacterium]|nr:beta/gamma crystallin family protein [bacterium]
RSSRDNRPGWPGEERDSGDFWGDDEEETSEERDGPGIVLYKHANFKGSSYFVEAGRNIKDLKSKGWNDMVSSIELVDNVKVQIFEHRNFQGASVLLSRDVIDLVQLTENTGGNWNDKVSSLKVLSRSRSFFDFKRQKSKDPDRRCIFYKHANRRGSSYEAKIGRHGKIPGSRNDSISSIWIEQGYRVTLYEHGNFGGKRLVLEGKYGGSM